jgi:hypothetical protein
LGEKVLFELVWLGDPLAAATGEEGSPNVPKISGQHPDFYEASDNECRQRRVNSMIQTIKKMACGFRIAITSNSLSSSTAAGLDLDPVYPQECRMSIFCFNIADDHEPKPIFRGIRSICG